MSKQTTRVKIVTSLNRRYHGKFCAMRIAPIHPRLCFKWWSRPSSVCDNKFDFASFAYTLALIVPMLRLINFISSGNVVQSSILPIVNNDKATRFVSSQSRDSNVVATLFAAWLVVLINCGYKLIHGMQWRQWIWTYLWSDVYDAILCVRSGH